MAMETIKLATLATFYQYSTTPTSATTIAKAMLALCGPLTMIVALCFCVMMGWASPFEYPASLVWYVVGTIAFMVVVMPLVMKWLMRVFYIGGRDELGARRRQRIMLLVVALCCAGCGSIYHEVVILFLVSKILFASSLLAVVLWIFELLFPLSHHTYAAGSLLAMMWLLLYIGNIPMLTPFLVAIVVSGLTITAHIHVRHTALWREVVSLALGVAFAMVLFVMV